MCGVGGYKWTGQMSKRREQRKEEEGRRKVLKDTKALEVENEVVRGEGHE